MNARLVLLGALLMGQGCSNTIRTIPKTENTSSEPSGPEPRTLRIGTARVDITPPPGPSMFGHGPDSVAAQGYWTHLECRVFVFEAKGRMGPERFAVVPCDLPAISYALYRDIAARAKDIVPVDHLLVTATHTHAGPAHYFEAPAYAGLLSTRRPGFDDVMLQMLSTRIANGISQAAAQVTDAELRWVTTRVWGLTRNRSLDAYELDGARIAGPRGRAICADQGGAPELVEPDAEGRKALAEGPCRNVGKACEAVDPLLETLEMRTAGRRPLGSITFFAMHPTVLPAHNRLFGADVFGVASRELERRMRLEWATSKEAKFSSPDSDPLAAIVNTNEGDIAPVWVVGNMEEARRVGHDLADGAWRTHVEKPEYTGRAILETRSVEADLMKAATFLHAGTDRPAMLGQGSSHGGSDHATTIDDILARLPDWSPDGAQEPKASLLGDFQPVLVERDAFPSRVAFSIWHIADRWLAAVPAELTLASGDRVRRAVEQVTGATHEQTLVAGLANGYMQYVATCEEFQLQRYEGGSTLYGPLTQSFISTVAANLACELTPPSGASCRPMSPGVKSPPFEALPLDPLVARDRFPKPGTVAGATEQKVCRMPGSDPPTFCFRWLDVAPGSLPLALTDRAPGPWLRVRKKGETATLRWDSTDPRSFVDDWSDDFRVRARFECPDHHFSYSALFSPTKSEWAGMRSTSATFDLVAPSEQEDRIKMPFGADSPACDRDELLYCTDDYDSATSIPALACQR